MPPLPNVANVIKCELIQDYQGTPVVNIVHFEYSGGPPSSANLNTFASTVATKWHADIHPVQCVDLFLTEVIATDLTTPSSGRGVAAVSTHGAITTGIVAAGSAVCIKKNIARRYRGGHPRMYLSGVNQADLASGQLLTTAAIGNWGNGADLFFSDVVSAGCPGTSSIKAVSVSYHSGHVLRPVPVVDDIVSIGIDEHICSQRRRNGGR